MCSIYFTLPAEDVGPELKEKFEQAQPFTTPTSSFAKQQRQAFKEYRPGSKDLLDDYIYKKRERRRRSSCKVLLVSQFTPPIPRTASKLLQKFMVLKFFCIWFRSYFGIFFRFMVYDENFKWMKYHPFQNLIIHHKS